MSGALLRRSIGHEGGQERQRGGDQPDGPGRAPAVVLRLDDRVHQHDQAPGDRHRAGQVERPMLDVGPRLGDEAQCGEQRHHAHRHVDEEDPLPGGQLGERATQDQADRATAGGDRAPHSERLGALTLLGERGRDDRQRGGREQRRAEALQAAADDQHARRLGQPVEQRGDREQRHAGDEQPLAPEQVAGPATQQEEAAEDQRVGVDHPLQARGREVQATLDRGQRDVHHGGVEHDHELGQAGDHQDQPPVRLADGGGLGDDGGGRRSGQVLWRGAGNGRSIKHLSGSWGGWVVIWNSAVRLG